MPPLVSLFQGDSIELLTTPPDGKAMRPMAGRVYNADACITDPPYGFDFGGSKDWDTFEETKTALGLDTLGKTTSADDAGAFAMFTERWVRAVMYNLHPGAHVAAFSADRTFDLLGVGMRFAGLEIVRTFFWLYASGQVKNPNDTRPGCEPIMCGRFFGEMGNLGDLTKLFKTKGRGQLQAQALKAEDGKHPTNVLIDQTLADAYPEVAAIVAEHPGTFFVPKPAAKERDSYCGDLPVQQKDNRLSHMTSNYTGKVVKPVMAQNVHPTVKSLDLMRRMVRTFSAPGHTIIDPFMGSGTTGVAAVLEGRNFIGFEREKDYFHIAQTRINNALSEVAAA